MRRVNRFPIVEFEVSPRSRRRISGIAVFFHGQRFLFRSFLCFPRLLCCVCTAALSVSLLTGSLRVNCVDVFGKEETVEVQVNVQHMFFLLCSMHVRQMLRKIVFVSDLKVNNYSTSIFFFF